MFGAADVASSLTENKMALNFYEDVHNEAEDERDIPKQLMF
jgi:hypothetical protein